MKADTGVQTRQGEVQTRQGERVRRESLARHLPVVARILMGLLFFASGVFGILIFFGIVPEPSAPMPPGAAAFAGALAQTGYMMALISGTQAVVGLLLLLNRFVPLALTLIAPVIINILAFHAFLAPSGSVPGIVAAGLELYLAWAYREAFRPMLAIRAGLQTAGLQTAGLQAAA